MRALWSGYLTAWPFALAHALVCVWVARDVARMLSETRALGGELGEGYIGRQLVGRLNATGQTPSTLDDAVSRAVDDLAASAHAHVSLFLLVGIAGTFFGMFGLASVTGETKPNELYSVFLAGLSNALPVGFFGVALTVVGQLVCGGVAERLRDAADAAVLAASHRAGNSQIASLASIDASLRTATDLLAQSLRPLAGVESVLADSLKPVIEKLDANLEGTQRDLKTHFESISAVLERFRGDLVKLETPVEHLSEASRAMVSAVSRIDEMVVRMEAGVQSKAEEFSTLHAALAASVERLDTSAKAIEAFPSAVSREVTSALATVNSDWRQIVQGYTESVARVTVSSNQQIASAAQVASQSIESAAGTLHQFSENAGVRLSRGIAEGAEALKKPLSDLHDSFKSEFPEAIRQGSEAIDRSIEHTAQLSRGLQSVGPLAEGINEALKGWREFGGAARQLSSEVRSASESLRQASASLRPSANGPRRWWERWRR
jgi:archaellum component FlaC